MSARFLLIVIACGILGCKNKGEPTAPPPEIEVVEVELGRLPYVHEYVGNVLGIRDMPVRTRVDGFLETMSFREGSMVKKGQLLYTVDSEPFQAQVLQYQSQLNEAMVKVVKAKNDLNRYTPLAAENAVSQLRLDASRAEYEASMAAAEGVRAQLKQAQIRLGYTRIYAPVNGLIGKTEARPGEFVGSYPNPVILNTISQLDTVRVEIVLPEQEYIALQRENTVGDRSNWDLTLVLSDGSIHPYSGVVDFLDREIDTEIGGISAQVLFPNPSYILRPGQFVRLKATSGFKEELPVIPLRATMEIQGEYYVFKVDEDDTVTQQSVQLGQQAGQMVTVVNGLKVGDRIALQGFDKLGNDVVIEPVMVQFKDTLSNGQ